MNLRIDLNKTIEWPNKKAGHFLDRTIDRDAIFRRTAILAAMRCIAPARHYANGSETWFKSHLESSDYPPLFDSMSISSCDPGAAMGALFRWDGGISETLEPGTGVNGFCRWSAVTPSENVFTFVLPQIERGSASEWTLEKAAQRGDVHGVFCSDFLYRYWWQAFNRAIFLLTEPYPNKTFEEVSVYPYHIATLPKDWNIPHVDSLTIDWTYHIEGFCRKNGIAYPGSEEAMEEFLSLYGGEVAEGQKFIPADTWWLLTAGDFTRYGLFTNDIKDCARNYGNQLRTLFDKAAQAVGFKSYASESTCHLMDRIPFVDHIEPYWYLDSMPLFKNNRLLQLDGDWGGGVERWKDEYPAHGYAAMLAWLRFFESSNGGFAISAGDWSELHEEEHAIRSVEMSTTLEEITPIEFTVPVGSFSFGEISDSEYPEIEIPIENKTWDHATYEQEILRYDAFIPQISVYDNGIPKVNSDLIVEWRFSANENITQIADKRYEVVVTGNESIFYGWRSGDLADADNHLRSYLLGLAADHGGWKFRLHGKLQCQAKVRIIDPTTKGRHYYSGDVSSDWAYSQFPLVNPENENTGCSYKEYQFLKTTYSSVILNPKSYESDTLTERMFKELDFKHYPNIGSEIYFLTDASQLPSFNRRIPIFFNEQFWLSLESMTGFDLSESDGATLTIKFAIPDEEPREIEIPFPSIRIGEEKVYPGVCGSFGESITSANVFFFPGVSAPPQTEESLYPCLHTQLLSARYIAFVKYPSFIINPHNS